MSPELARIRIVLKDLVKWYESHEVKSSFDRLGEISITHPHLAVHVSDEFAAWAGRIWSEASQMLDEMKS